MKVMGTIHDSPWKRIECEEYDPYSAFSLQCKKALNRGCEKLNKISGNRWGISCTAVCPDNHTSSVEGSYGLLMVSKSAGIGEYRAFPELLVCPVCWKKYIIREGMYIQIYRSGDMNPEHRRRLADALKARGSFMPASELVK